MTVLNCDCTTLDMDLIAGADVIICDPPFRADVHANMMSTHTLESGGPSSRDPGFDPLTPELLSFLVCCASLVSRWALFHTDFESIHDYIRMAEHFKVEYIRTMPWVRWSQPQLSGDRPAQGGEGVVWIANEASAAVLMHAQHVGIRGGTKPIAKHWNGFGGLTHFDERCLRGADKHPTEKPIDLLLTQVSAFSDPGDLVLDLCAGSCTTTIACKILERGCVCVEKDPRWAERGERRERATVLAPAEQVRCEEWYQKVHAEASAHPTPRNDSERPAWERAQRRLADAERVRKYLNAQWRGLKPDLDHGHNSGDRADPNHDRLVGERVQR